MLIPIAHAAAADKAAEFVVKINEAILYPLIILLAAVALVVFIYGAFEYVAGANNDQKREQGRNHLLYGIIGLLVMMSAVAILNVAAATFNLSADPDDFRAWYETVEEDPYGVGEGGETEGTFVPVTRASLEAEIYEGVTAQFFSLSESEARDRARIEADLIMLDIESGESDDIDRLYEAGYISETTRNRALQGG